MSMSLFMGLQCTGIFLAYMFITVGLPSLVLGKRFRHLRLSERFTVYFIIGNFFVINLVFALQLMKISNRFALLFCTILTTLLLYCKGRGISPRREILTWWMLFDRILAGKLGLKTVLYRFWKRFCVFFGKAVRKLKHMIFPNLAEFCILLAFTVLFLNVYGQDVVTNFGYGASDMPVHNYWINYLGKNKVFVAGIYPFGFHNVIYYLHEVFKVDTYVILRVFCLTQNYLVNIMLLCLLKYCCKAKYTPYLGILVYSLSNIFPRHTYSRFYSSLPQEFGMIFIYPSVYFAFAFFKERKEKRPSGWCLAGFAMSFSMTLAVHFYGTMIAGLFCVGIAVGFFARFIRLEYFKRIMITCVISVALAVLPMGIAFAGGTPLQGSLGWGMNILTGGQNKKETGDTSKNQAAADAAEKAVANTQGQTDAVSQNNPGTDAAPSGEAMNASAHTAQNPTQNTTPPNMADMDKTEEAEGQTEQIPPAEKIIRKLKELPDTAINKTKTYIFSSDEREDIVLFYKMLAGLLAAGFLMILFRQSDYGGILISTCVFIVCLALLLISKEAGLPTLMDPSRCSIYMAYAVPLAMTLSVDVILFVVMGWLGKTRFRWVYHGISMIVLAGVFLFCRDHAMLKEPSFTTGFQTNEAVTCLTNILREEEDFKWTICSANDELRMGEDHGYHYETIEFLRKMERSGDNAMLTIPTETVYFFIEKKPLDYAVKYEGSGQYISRKLAARQLPTGNGLSIYQAENRCIVMSRLYYWAQEFLEMYPNEMKVYLETDNFVCYKITQNMYRLYNFAIDYGYNTQIYRD